MDIQKITKKINKLKSVKNRDNLSLFDKAQAVYLNKVQNDLKKIFNQRFDDLLAALEDYLAKNWLITKGTALSYTAICKAEITSLLVDIAVYIADQKNRNQENKIMPIEILMPGLKLESYSDNYPHLQISKAFYHWNEQKKSELSSLLTEYNFIKNTVVNNNEHENSADSNHLSEIISETKILNRITVLREEEKGFCKETAFYSVIDDYLVPRYDLLNLLSQSILASDKNSLIPIHVFIEKEVYNPYSQNYAEITTDELQRFTGHSELSQAFVDANANLIRLQEDESNLLGHLITLCKKLKINEVNEGIGQENNAGSGAYAAIIDFLEYFKTLSSSEKEKIPDDLLKEINLLLQLSSDPTKNKNATENLDTCIASRRRKIQSIVNENILLLSSIACTKEAKTQLILQAEEKLNLAKNAFLNSLNKNSYSGIDLLPLTKQILDYLNIEITLKSLQDLYIFMRLSSVELNQFLNDKNICSSIATIFINVEELVIFIHENSIEKLEILFTAIHAFLFKRLCHNIKEINAILSSLTAEKFILMFNWLQQQNFDFWDLNAIIRFFVLEPQILKVINQLIPKDEFLILISKKNLLGYTSLHFAAACPESMKFLFGLFSKEEASAIIEANEYICGNLLHEAVINVRTLDYLLSFITAANYENLLTNVQHSGMTVFHCAAQYPASLRYLLELFPITQRLNFINMIDNEQNNVFHKAVNKAGSLKVLFELLPQKEFFQLLLEDNLQGKKALHKSLINTEAFKFCLEILPKENILPVFKARDKWHSNLFFHINNSDCLDLMIDAIPEKDCDDSELMTFIEKNNYILNERSINKFYIKCINNYLDYRKKNFNFFNNKPDIKTLSQIEVLKQGLQLSDNHAIIASIITLIDIKDKALSIIINSIKRMICPNVKPPIQVIKF